MDLVMGIKGTGVYQTLISRFHILPQTASVRTGTWYGL